jgi:hypothetical protein
VVIVLNVKDHVALDGLSSRAIYSDCERYRYLLTRRWDRFRASLMFIMLNPSTATELENDPTVERIERRARMNGFGGITILNLFAFRATDPADMKRAADPVGEQNDYFIRQAIETAEFGDCELVCGWGTHGTFLKRDEKVKLLFAERGYPQKALKWTKDGHPQHPLYVSYAEQPKEKNNV